MTTFILINNNHPSQNKDANEQSLKKTKPHQSLSIHLILHNKHDRSTTEPFFLVVIFSFFFVPRHDFKEVGGGVGVGGGGGRERRGKGKEGAGRWGGGGGGGRGGHIPRDNLSELEGGFWPHTKGRSQQTDTTNVDRNQELSTKPNQNSPHGSINRNKSQHKYQQCLNVIRHFITYDAKKIGTLLLPKQLHTQLLPKTDGVTVTP